MDTEKELLLSYLAVFFACVIILSGLAGCAHKGPQTMNISCFVADDSKKTKAPVEGLGPVIVSNGTVLFYDEDGFLNRIKDAVCGIK